jgi:hypothetical protein
MHESKATEVAFEYFPSLRNFLWTLALFVTWFGFISTSTYYAQFGISYYSLAIPLQHMFNRGLTIILSNFAFGLIFICIFVVLSLAETNTRFRLLNLVIHPLLYAPAVLSIMFIIGWYVAFVLARDAAYRDMYSRTTNLSLLIDFRSNAKEKESYVRTLMGDTHSVMMLYADRDFILIFREPTFEVEVPKIPVYNIPLEKSDVYVQRAAS